MRFLFAKSLSSMGHALTDFAFSHKVFRILNCLDFIVGGRKGPWNNKNTWPAGKHGIICMRFLLKLC